MKLILTECPSGNAIRVDGQIIYYAGRKDGIVSFTTDRAKAIDYTKADAPIVASYIMESLDIRWFVGRAVLDGETCQCFGSNTCEYCDPDYCEL